MRQIWHLKGKEAVWIASLFVCHPLVHLCQHFEKVVAMRTSFNDLDQDLVIKKVETVNEVALIGRVLHCIHRGTNDFRGCEWG